MAKVSMQGRGNPDRIRDLIIDEMSRSGMTVELVDRVSRHLEGISMEILVFEKYYMRSSNRASLTVVVTSRKEEIMVDAIGAGGGQGIFFKWSWGAEESFVSVIENILLKENFVEI